MAKSKIVMENARLIFRNFEGREEHRKTQPYYAKESNFF